MANISTLLQNRRGSLAISNVTGLQTALDAKFDSADIASQAVAEAGTDNTKVMTPLRTKQAIDSYGDGDVLALTPAATVNIDLLAAEVFTLTPNQSTTFTLSNTTAVDSFTLTLTGFAVATGFRLVSTTYDSVSFSLSSQTTSSRGSVFNPDGTKMYVPSNTGDTIYQYTLSTGFDLSTASYASISFSVSAQVSSLYAVAFNTDGTKMYAVDYANSNVRQYTLSTGFDISTASYDTVSPTLHGTICSLEFDPSGTIITTTNYTGSQTVQHTLSTPWDVSTASSPVTFSGLTGPVDTAFNADGTKMYVLSYDSNVIHQYSLSTAYSAPTATWDNISYNAASYLPVYGLNFSADGTKMFISNTTTVHQFTTSSLLPATYTYPAAFKWPGGTLPDAPADGETDVIKAFTTNSGATWYAFKTGEAMS